jgi:hypothetical protein
MNVIFDYLGVPKEVDNYHALCPLEPLDTPADQVRLSNLCPSLSPLE